MKRIVALLFTLNLLSHFTSGQGTLRGKVTDDNGEPLIGATIMVKAPKVIGTVTDFDGNYSIKITEINPQPVVVSFIGFVSIEDTVNPKNNEVLVRNYDMKTVSNEIGEITIVGRASKAKESYMEKVKLSSGTFLDYISTETIKKTGDSNVTSAVSRITGVSTFGGFITVRGIGDRYVKTTINGLRIPTLDPFTNNIKLDLFPASLVDNIIINKTTGPNLPGDWSAAYLSIETKEYPDRLTIQAETTVGYNSQSTFNAIISSERSLTDWLGFDNNFRNINHQKPVFYDLNNYKYQEFSALGLQEFLNSQGITEETKWDNNDYTSIYTRLCLVELGYLGKAEFYDITAVGMAVNSYNSSELKQEGLARSTGDVVKMGQSLPNTWLPVNRRAPVEFSQSLSIGNQSTIFRKQVGYLFGIRYYRSSLFDNNSYYGRTSLIPEQAETLTNPADIYHTYGPAESSVETNGWSALFNASLKFNANNSIVLLFMPNMIGSNRARNVDFFSNQSGSPINYTTASQFYESRQQLVYQVKTDHYLPSLKMKINFAGSFTDAKSNSPDYRQLNYIVDKISFKPTQIYVGSSEESSNFRMFRDLTESLFDSYANAEIPVKSMGNLGRKIRFGGTYQRLVRKAYQKFYLLPPTSTEGRIENNDLYDYLSLERFGYSNGKVERYYYQLSGQENNTIGFSESFGGFTMVDFALNKSFKLSGGLRYENVHMHTDIEEYYEKQYSVIDDRREGIKPGLRDEQFLLPNANLVYTLNRSSGSQINLRLNYSKTYALPSLRELTPFSVYDYTMLGVVTGNPDLKPVNINNWDLRGEAYFSSGNNVSLSLFYKDFKNHIEMVRLDLDQVYYSWQNTDDSRVTGVELEGKISIMRNLEFRGNATMVESRTRLANDTITRSMFGQAPFMLNGMLLYNSTKHGIEFSLSYNLQGPKLIITGTYGEADIYELSRSIMDIKLTKTIGKSLLAGLRVRDILNEPYVKAYKFQSRWIDFERYHFGSMWLLSLTYTLN